MKIYIVDDNRALWPEEYEAFIERTIEERAEQVSDKINAMENMIQWIEDYAKRAYDPDIIYYRFEIEPEKSALLQQLWTYAKKHAGTEANISIENFGGSSGSMIGPCAVVRCYNNKVNALSQLAPILRLGMPELKEKLAVFYSRDQVESDIGAQILELNDR